MAPNLQQRELDEQAWVLLRHEGDLEEMLLAIARQHVVPLTKAAPPATYPCLAKYTFHEGRTTMVYCTEEDAIGFLRAAKTADRLQGDAPDRQGQDGWNRQMTALVMAVVQVLIDKKICTRDQFEIKLARSQTWVEQEVAEYLQLGKDPETATFLNKIFTLQDT